MEKAQKGDLIRITNAQTSRGNYKNGDIFEVAGTWGNGVIIDNNSQCDVINDVEYVIHRKAGEEDSPTVGKVMENIAKLRDDVTQAVKPQDAVNHPNHYTQGKFETIEIIEEITKGYSDGYVAYCVGNALKYLARAPFKHGEPSEDLSKAARYLAFASEYLDAKSTQD